MRILRPLLELYVVAWTAWVVVFQLAIATRLPTRWLPWLFAVALVAAIAPWIRSWQISFGRVRQNDKRLVLELFVVAVMLSTIVLVASRWDADDLGYLRGPLIDAAAPEEPVRIDRFRWDDRSWPVLHLLNENEAFEPFVVMVSRLIGLDPLVGYHNVFLVFSVFVWCVVLAGLLLHFRVPSRWIAGAVLCSAFLLFLDGGTHRSFGNMTLIRLWQGKIVAWTIVLPLFVLFQMRFLARPRVARFVLVLMAGIVGVAFNRSMVVMLVVAGTAVPIAYAIAFGVRQGRFCRRRLRRVGVALAAPAAGWILGGLVVILVLRASPDELAGALAGWPGSTVGAGIVFQKVTGSAWTIVARDVWLLGALPVVIVARPLGPFLAAFSVVVAVSSFLPPIGGLFSMALGESVWRLYHVLPVPLCLGLLVLVFRPIRMGSRRVGRWLVALLIMALWMPRVAPVLSADNRVEWKAPLEYRFPAGVREFVRVAGPRLENHRVLAPEYVAVALGLTHFDRAELIATRVHYASGNRLEMLGQADRALSKCTLGEKPMAALRELLAEDPGFLVFTDCGDGAFAALDRALVGYRLKETLTAGGYRLFEVSRDAAWP